MLKYISVLLTLSILSTSLLGSNLNCVDSYSKLSKKKQADCLSAFVNKTKPPIAFKKDVFLNFLNTEKGTLYLSVLTPRFIGEHEEMTFNLAAINGVCSVKGIRSLLKNKVNIELSVVDTANKSLVSILNLKMCKNADRVFSQLEQKKKTPLNKDLNTSLSLEDESYELLAKLYLKASTDKNDELLKIFFRSNEKILKKIMETVRSKETLSREINADTILKIKQNIKEDKALGIFDKKYYSERFFVWKQEYRDRVSDLSLNEKKEFISFLRFLNKEVK